MNTNEKLERYSDLQDQLTFLNTAVTELKERAVPDELKAQWEFIKASIAKCQADIEAEYNPMIDSVNAEATTLMEEIKSETLELSQTVKGTRLMVVWAKGRSSWEGKLLDGFAMAYPEILQAKKIGEPTVSIRSVK